MLVSAPSLTPLTVVWVACACTFTAAFIWIPRLAASHPRTVAALLVWQMLVATVVDTDLAYIFAMMLAFVFPWRRAAWWLVARNVLGLPFLVYLITVVRPESTAIWIAGELGIHIVWQCFMFAVGLTVATERNARAALATVNEELVATQALVADRSRLAERLAISRELHDTIGHHLAALNVQLELARHHASGPALDAVVRAQATGRQLLAELRGVVSTWRDESLDLRTALDALARAIDRPAVVVHIDDAVTCEPEVTRTLVRCAQELVTNSVRHAGATQIWLDLVAKDGGIALIARDDGRAAQAIVPGNGLRGLAERAEVLHGRVDILSRPGDAVRVEVWVPAP